MPLWQLEKFNFFDTVLAGGYLIGVYGGFLGVGLVWLRSRTGLFWIFFAPTLWIWLEYIRNHVGFLSVPWLLLGHTQYEHVVLIQICSLTGVFGLSFLIVLINAACADLFFVIKESDLVSKGWLRRLRCNEIIKIVAIPVFLLGAFLCYGVWAMTQGIATPKITVAVLQTSVPLSFKWDRKFYLQILGKHLQMTAQIDSTQPPELIVWPENAIPGDFRGNQKARRVVEKAAQRLGSFLYVGASENLKASKWRRKDKVFNAMYLIEPSGKLQGQYNKMALLPFGEYDPLEGYMPFPEFLGEPYRNHKAGQELTVMATPQGMFGTLICWESFLPYLARDFVNQGVRYFVNPSNEGWFSGSAPTHFLIATIFRSVENRTPIIRATNYGFSALIDSWGRVVRQVLKPSDEEVLVGELSLGSGPTFYTKFGDVFLVVAILWCFCSSFFQFRRTLSI